MNEINKLVEEFGLLKDKHIYYDKQNEYTIITKLGIQHIINKRSIQITFSKPYKGVWGIAIKATGHFLIPYTTDTNFIPYNSYFNYESYGEASEENNTFPYPVAVAEKRAEARVVIKMIFKEHEEQVMGEVELPSSVGAEPKKGKAIAKDLLNKHKQ